MKLCTNCGLNYEDHFDQCPGCADPDYSTKSEKSDLTRNEKRPDGSIMIPIGWLGAIVGAFCVLIANGKETTDYMGRIDPDALADAALLMGAGEGFLQLGIAILMAGYIVGAISFLPGRGDQ